MAPQEHPLAVVSSRTKLVLTWVTYFTTYAAFTNLHRVFMLHSTCCVFILFGSVSHVFITTVPLFFFCVYISTSYCHIKL